MVRVSPLRIPKRRRPEMQEAAPATCNLRAMHYELCPPRVDLAARIRGMETPLRQLILAGRISTH